MKIISTSPTAYRFNTILTYQYGQGKAESYIGVECNFKPVNPFNTMSNQYNSNRMGIPISVKIFTWLLICAGSFFFYVYTFKPVISFPNANLDTYSARMGFASAGVRILGSILALLISALANNPKWLFITLISRIFIELGDVVVGLILDGVTANTFSLTVLAGLEIWAVSRLWNVIKANP